MPEVREKHYCLKYYRRKYRILSFGIVTVFFILVLAGWPLVHVSAAAALRVPAPTKNAQGVESNTGEQTGIELWKIISEGKTEALREAGAVAFKQALGYFLKTLAIDTATYIATGGEGQKPLFYTEGWGAYLAREADYAAGHFINSFARGVGLENICTFNFRLKLGITLGLQQAVRPRKPACSFSQLLNNWEKELSDPVKFLEGIDSYFNPNENDFAIGLSVYSNFFSERTGNLLASEKDREEGQGKKSVVDEITGSIKTPASTVQSYEDSVYGKVGLETSTYTGKPVADAVDAFLSTLTSKLLVRLFEKGLGSSPSYGKERRFDWESLEALTSPDASPNRSDREAAREEFSAFISPRVSIGNPTSNRVDVTTELLNDGVINTKFKTAIDRRFTIGQAISEGLLQLDGPGSAFGFTSTNNQPDVHEGYSHNSMIILRKYRILPVGWELAAAYIKYNFQNRIFSLGDIVRGFDNPSSPFFRMIDTDWVLKSPETFCRFEGPGEELVLSDWNTETIIDDSQNPPREYEFNEHTVSRKDYCADSKSCIYEDGNGSCLYYGYCTEEKSVWRFNGESCPAYYNTCQTYVNEDNDSLAYLAGTLDAQDCSVDTIGCQWYCSEFNRSDNRWACLAEGERVYKSCDNAAGCPVVDAATGETCTIAFGSISCSIPACRRTDNILSNGSFERIGASSRVAEGWETFGDDSVIERVSGLGQRVVSGTYSLRMSYFGGTRARFLARTTLAISNNEAGPVAYTLLGKVFNSLTYGRAYLAVVDDAGSVISLEQVDENGCATLPDMAKGQWNTVSCSFSVSPGTQTVHIGLIMEDANYPVGDVWFDDIGVQPACPEQDVIVYMNAEESLDESKIYFDKDIVECEESDAGCHQFIRTRAGLGTNLVVNGSFEQWSDAGNPLGWTVSGGTVTQGSSQPQLGQKYVIPTPGADVDTIHLIAFEANKRYILSFYARKTAADNPSFSSYLVYSTPAQPNNPVLIPFQDNTPLDFTENWQRYVSDPFIIPTVLQSSNFRIRLNEDNALPEVHIDGVMLEEVLPSAQNALAYGEYGERNVTYLKKPPEYLQCTGDPERDHSSCQNYALVCSSNEVGCSLYTPSSGNPPVPGIITEFDRCPRECVGYQSYKQSATNFEREKISNFFIASTARQCPASAVGCEEFTNLEEVERGGERKEYYKYLRQCIKPNDSCKTFYTWVGSDVAGYQLKVYILKDEINNVTGASGEDGIPDTVVNPRTDLGFCADAQDAQENPHCRELYSTSNAAGAPAYVILQNTIACEDECSAYRQSNTEKEDCEYSGGAWGVCTVPPDGTHPDGNLVDASECASVGGFVMLGSGECWTRESAITVGAVTFQGCDFRAGTIFEPRNQCIFQAIPRGGEQCNAADSSCREYKGNSSANVRTVFFDNFETGAASNWSTGQISNDALAVGGHSLLSVPQGANQVIQTFEASLGAGITCGDNLPACSDTREVGCWNASTRTCFVGASALQRCEAREGETSCGIIDDVMVPGANYIVSFWAKSASARVLDADVELDTAVGTKTVGTVTLNQDWQEYLLGPFEVVANEVGVGMHLWFIVSGAASNAVNYDFVTLKVVQQFHYLIKNSWRTPDSCDINPYTAPPAPAPQFMLGCQEYRTQDNTVAYLKSFDRLCRESAVGCEKLIDTQNTASFFAQTFNEQYPASRIDIPEDSVAYMVYDPDKACGADAKGCQALGLPTLSEDNERIVSYDTKYFINDPERYGSILCNEDNVGCRQYVSEREGIVYFKDPKSRTCEYKQVLGSTSYGWFKTGSTSSFPDCPSAPDDLKVEQPGSSCVGGDTPGAVCGSDTQCPGGGGCVPWVGICPEETSGCNAYVDPQSVINPNSVVNGNFEGYFKICSQSQSACLSQDQCPQGETCGPETRLYQWILSDASRVTHTLTEGYGSSAGIGIAGDGGPHSLSQGRVLAKKTMYTIFVRAKNSSADSAIRIETNLFNTFSHFDNSVQINQNGNTVIVPMHNPTDAYTSFSGRFFVNENDANVTLRVIASSGFFDDISLKKTGIYYYLAQTVDSRSCSATVNTGQGCVLFNDTSQTPLSFSSLRTPNNAPAAVCGNEGCDSNTVIKVTPDRDCGKWLECVSGREQSNFLTGKNEVFCQQIAECDSLNPVNGQCNNFPPVTQTAQEFNPGNIDLIKNISGYAKVGFQWNEGTRVEGLYAYAAMEQKRICVKPLDKFGASCIEDEDCNTSTLENDGVCQPILEVGDEKQVYESCRLYPENGSMRWGEQGPNDDGTDPAASVIVDVNNPLGRKNWENVDSLNQSILADAAECTYKKDNTIFEGIYGFCVEKDPRSPYLCLNWLPVDEITGGWIGVTGWNDNLRESIYYCTEGSVLETRKSRTEDRCYRENWAESTGSLHDPDRRCGRVICPSGYIPSVSERSCGDWPQVGVKCSWSCTPDPSDFTFTDANDIPWYDYKLKTDMNGNFSKKHIMYCPDCGSSGKVIYDPEGEEGSVEEDDPRGWLRICEAVTKVTDDDGTNRAWSRRVEAIREFDESGYRVPDYQYVIDDTNKPFGSVGRRWTGDPGTWDYLTDFVSALRYDQPVYNVFVESENVGQLFHDSFSVNDPYPFLTSYQGGKERVKRLFAQNFGEWFWDGNAYRRADENEQRCVGGSRDGDICDIADTNSCTDSSSFCTADAGYCGYLNDTGQLTVRDEGLRCNDNPNAPSATCQAYVFCAIGFCSTGTPDTSSFDPCRNSSDCRGGETCYLPETTGVQSDDYGECSGAGAGWSCTTDEQCLRAFGAASLCDKSSNPGYCSTGIDTGKACQPAAAGSCRTSGATCIGQCSGGSVISGQSCFRDPSAAPGVLSADTFCRRSGTCESFSFWTPPATICPNNIRPNYFTETPFDASDSLAPGDWCGVSPLVFNATVQNSVSPQFEIRGGSGEITLSFNVKVDDDQLPLKLLEIDWGDSQPSTITASRLGIRDKRDSRDPFVFPHIYTYDRAYDQGCQISQDQCDGFSEYKIHILVKDNWGWCTCKTITDANGAVICRPASSVDGQCPNQEPSPDPTWQELDTSNSWISVNTIIRVYEQQ